MTQRHKVFISYHHENDQCYRNEFERLFADYFDIMISMAVQDGDINPMLNAEYVRQVIRDRYLRESSVTVVLVGTETWKRKHVDWEISSTIRDTPKNPRGGLLGILLPTRLDVNTGNYCINTVPPRLHINVEKGYAKIYNWSTDPNEVQNWIHQAFIDRNSIIPDNKLSLYGHNRSGERWQP